MSNCRQMQNGVGTAANSHVDGDSVLESLERENIARADIFLEQIHDDFTGAFGKNQTGAVVRGGNCAVAGQSHSERFAEAVHSIGGEKSGAGTAARAGFAFEFGHFGLRHLTGGEFTGGFKALADADISAVKTTGEHRTAADDNRRNVESRGSHEHTRHNFIAVRN